MDKIFKEYFDKVFSNYEKIEFDPYYYDYLYEIHNSEIYNLELNDKIIFHSIQYTIIDNKLYYDCIDKKAYSDGMVEYNFQIIDGTLRWCRKNKKRIPNCVIYCWLNDAFPYFDKYKKFPVMTHATPNYINPILPDITFECLELYKKYGGHCHNWDEIVRMFAKQDKSFAHKIRKIYFKGTPTTRKTSKIREYLERYAKNQEHMIIELDAWTNYIPITEFSKYQILLNLPGHYPWSNRFKYLFLTGSIVVNITNKTIQVGEVSYADDIYRTFIDLIMEKDIDYINIEFTYYRYKGDDEKLFNDCQEKNRKEINNVIEKLEEIYRSLPNKKYEKMITSYTNKIKNLTMNTLYEYMYLYMLYLENHFVF